MKNSSSKCGFLILGLLLSIATQASSLGVRCNEMKMAKFLSQLKFKTNFQEMLQCKYSIDTGEKLFLAQPLSMTPLPVCDFERKISTVEARQLQAINTRIAQKQIELDSSRDDNVYTLPIVFHVIHQGEPIGSGHNISEAQIHSAVAELNKHFRKTPGSSGDGDGVDVKIQFQLAVRDPNNNPTNGIVRVNGAGVTNYIAQGIASASAAGANEMSIKNLSRWDQTKYINIWVVHKIGNGTSIQGYATFPTTSSSDGIVIVHSALGTQGTVSFNQNKSTTLTHEMGHYLTLYHTFHTTTSCVESNCSTQGDRVCDTPTTTQNSSCSNPACSTNPSPQNVHLYMDYTGQSCKNAFTLGQKSRMRSGLLSERISLTTSSALTNPVTNDIALTEVLSPLSSTCSGHSEIKLLVTNLGQNTVTGLNLKVRKNIFLLLNQDLNVSIPAGSSQVVSFNGINLAPGLNNLKFTLSRLNGQPDDNALNNSKTKKINYSTNNISARVSVSLDHFGTETTWNIKSTTGEILYSGGPYTNNTPNVVHNHDVCLAQGCYIFSMQDSYGDGQSLVHGSYSLSQGNNVLATGADDWGSEQVHNFCVD